MHFLHRYGTLISQINTGLWLSWESVRFASERSRVRIPSGPPKESTAARRCFLLVYMIVGIRSGAVVNERPVEDSPTVWERCHEVTERDGAVSLKSRA